MLNSTRKPNYADHMYARLKRQGLAPKYEHPGIYSIRVGDQLVYIGKSCNMLRRIAQHYVGIRTRSEHKYRLMAKAQRQGYSISFDVLYDAKAKTVQSAWEEIGSKEGEYIRAYRPILNYQIPNSKNWHRYTVNAKAKQLSFAEFLKEIQASEKANQEEI